MSNPFAAIESAINRSAVAALANASAIIDGVRVDGVFDARYADPLGISGVRPAFASSAPAALNAASSASVVVTCDPLGVAAAPYVVIERQPEHGLVRLILERAE